MSQLDDYRKALLAAFSDIPGAELEAVLDAKGDLFAGFVIDHGLGPLWHDRTGHNAFHESRMLAEALFLAQEKTLLDIGVLLDAAAIEHVIIKGGANRVILYENPAIRACFDLDICVRREDNVRAASILAGAGFLGAPEPVGISRVLMLTRNRVGVDLHWGFLREGRLRREPIGEMLAGRRKLHGMWMLSAEHMIFTLLVHPAFAKHLSGWDMGLHRVADLLFALRSTDFNWAEVRSMLDKYGVGTAAWATLRWTDLLAGEHGPDSLREMLDELSPGHLRRRWLEFWLRNNLPERTSRARWVRLLGFSLFLHDTVGDAIRAAAGRYRAKLRSNSDLEAFRNLLG